MLGLELLVRWGRVRSLTPLAPFQTTVAAGEERVTRRTARSVSVAASLPVTVPIFNTDTGFGCFIVCYGICGVNN